MSSKKRSRTSIVIAWPASSPIKTAGAEAGGQRRGILAAQHRQRDVLTEAYGWARENPRESDDVVWIAKDAQQRDHVLDLGAVVEPVAARHDMRNASLS